MRLAAAILMALSAGCFFMTFCGCAALPPIAREVESPATIRDELAIWYELGGTGAPPRTIFVEPHLGNGFQSQNGHGVLEGERIGEVVYIALLPNWRQTMRHEFAHAILRGDAQHSPKYWLRCGERWCPDPAHFKPRYAVALLNHKP